MKAVTLRNIPAELAQVVRRRALDQHTSINKAVISLLAEMIGIHSKKTIVHHDLDHLAGRWAMAEAKKFDQALADQRTIDPGLWK